MSGEGDEEGAGGAVVVGGEGFGFAVLVPGVEGFDGFDNDVAVGAAVCCCFVRRVCLDEGVGGTSLTAEGGDACAADGEVGGPGDGVDVYFDVPFALLDWKRG